MRTIFINTIIIMVFGVNIFAQTPNYNIIITPATGNDTVIMPLLGVISGPLPPPSSDLPDITPQLQDIGVTSIRNNDNRDDKLDMEALFRCDNCFSNPIQNATWVPAWCCDPTDPNNLHFEESDSLFRAIRDGGFKLFFRLGGEANSALSHQYHFFQGPPDTVAENNWIRATIPVVEHYDNFEGDSNLLDYLDVWTEWPNPNFWQRSDSEFIWFFTKALDTLKRHFPDKKIGGPGFLVPTALVIQGNVHNKAVDLLTSLYEHNVKPDFISWHLWSIDPYDYYLAGENFRKLLDGTYPFNSVPWAGTNFFEGVEIICGAWGTPKINLSAEEQDLLYNRQKGAALLTADWIAMQETNTTRAFYYRCADVPLSVQDSTIEPGSGIFYGDSNVTYKPKAYAFKQWSRLYNEFPKKLSTDFPVVANDSSKLWVLAAKNSQDAYGILIANIDSINKTFTVNISGITIDTSNFDIYYYMVNDNENGSESYLSDDNNFDIPLQTVMLIRILPKGYSYVEEVAEIKTVKIFPNPSTGIIYLKNIKGYKIQIMDITGKIVCQFPEINEELKEIDLSKLTPGVYFVKCYNKNLNHLQSKKIIIY